MHAFSIQTPSRLDLSVVCSFDPVTFVFALGDLPFTLLSELMATDNRPHLTDKFIAFEKLSLRASNGSEM
jgi:hypothetical protein